MSIILLRVKDFDLVLCGIEVEIGPSLSSVFGFDHHVLELSIVEKAAHHCGL